MTCEDCGRPIADGSATRCPECREYYDEPYWGEPKSEAERQLVAQEQLSALFRVAGL